MIKHATATSIDVKGYETKNGDSVMCDWGHNRLPFGVGIASHRRRNSHLHFNADCMIVILTVC